MGIMILVATAVAAAFLFHSLINRYLLASLISAACASTAFQFMAALKLGYIDQFAVVALVTGGFIAFGIALICGIPFQRARRSR